eukprot:TRINITY_DN1127_c0_g1_i1.p1 TRINITY_DN1127_c0_g1~~TRINITY_DN1127_c0_g1_i1.p1  ORF type:complete len:221 (-),score=65.18 TRINITY_DN1127_c0_g1_i1:224-886(-)
MSEQSTPKIKVKINTPDQSTSKGGSSPMLQRLTPNIIVRTPEQLKLEKMMQREGGQQLQSRLKRSSRHRSNNQNRNAMDDEDEEDECDDVVLGTDPRFTPKRKKAKVGGANGSSSSATGIQIQFGKTEGKMSKEIVVESNGGGQGTRRRKKGNVRAKRMNHRVDFRAPAANWSLIQWCLLTVAEHWDSRFCDEVGEMLKEWDEVEGDVWELEPFHKARKG